METNASNRKDIWARQQLASVYSKVGQSLEEAAKTAAYKVVEAEEKANLAAEAVIEAEKLSKLAEETDSILQFAEEILDRCKVPFVELLFSFSFPDSAVFHLLFSGSQVLEVE